MRTPSTALALTLILAGCAQDPYSPAYKVGARYDAYERFRPKPIEIAQLRASYLEQKRVFDEREAQKTEADKKYIRKTFSPLSTVRNPYAEVKVTDVDVVLYADHVRNILATRCRNARFGSYTSATVQVLLAGGAGLAAAFSGGTSVIAGLAFGSAVTPEVSKIFGPRERASLYQQQATEIDIALKEFADEDVEDNGDTVQPSDSKLTRRGRELYIEVVAATNAVEGGLVSKLPATLSDEQIGKIQADNKKQFQAVRDQFAWTQKALKSLDEKVEDLAKPAASPLPSPSPSSSPDPTPKPTPPATNEHIQ